eukprot:GHVU01139704.1.p1 GENE.GHVU01139704.1~~GHVU01139704.1.p1  ORF type:complete len:224 (+),score=12.23 GHVU01139704.1:66-737(+)
MMLGVLITVLFAVSVAATDEACSERLARLETLVTNKVRDLQSDIRDAEARHKTRVAELEAELEKQKVLLQQSPNQLSTRANPIGSFSAYLSGTNYYSQYQAIIFQGTVYNTGDYSTSTGIFTSPISAVYGFYVNIISCSASYTSITIRLRKGSTTIGYIGSGYDSYTGYHTYNSGSAMIYINVLTGEQVMLDAYSYTGSSYCIRSDSSYGYSWYSAFLVETTI